VYFRRAQAVPILRGELVNHELVENVLNVLEIGHVATCTNDSMVANCVQTLDVLESCKGTVRSWCTSEQIHNQNNWMLTKVVGSHHDAVFVFDSQDTRASDNWLSEFVCTFMSMKITQTQLRILAVYVERLRRRYPLGHCRAVLRWDMCHTRREHRFSVILASAGLF